MNIKADTIQPFWSGIFITTFFLLLASSCGIFQGGKNKSKPGLETVKTNKDSSSIVNNIPPPPPPPLRVDTIVWIDTLQENEYKKIVLRYTKIGKNPSRVDTLQVIDISGQIEYPAKKEIQKREIRQKSSYNIAIVMPFMTASHDFKSEVSPLSLRAVEFYEGLKLALDSLEREGLRLDVRVYDSQRDAEEVNNILTNPELAEADLIFGPVNTSALRQVANFGLQYAIPVVSVFNNYTEVTEDNHYFIQVNPSFEVQSRYIGTFAAKHIKIPTTYPQTIKKINYLMLGMAEDTVRMSEVQNAYSLALNDPQAKIPQKVLTAGAFSIENIKSHFSPDAINVVVVPSYRNEAFVSAVLRELSALVDKVESKNSYQFLVIGMPQWKYFERVNFEYYENLQLHFPDEYYIDANNTLNKEFRKGYKARYGIAPREFAYIGFDVMLYFGRLLKKHGTGFPEHFDQETYIGRHTQFHFEPMMRHRKIMDSGNIIEQQLIKRFENNYTNFVQFKDYEFKALDLGVLKGED